MKHALRAREILGLASLPMRERELKLRGRLGSVFGVLSLPMRERELKHYRAGFMRAQLLSLPMRERELKRLDYASLAEMGCRSPCGSAN